MSKERDKIIEALENISIKFDELGFSPTIPIFKGDKAHFVDWFKIEIDTIKVVTNKQAQRIAELEEQLKNSISPKFKIGQKVWYYHIARNKIYDGIVEDIQWRPINGMYYRISNLQRNYFWIIDNELFATKEEALAKLEELI